VQEISETAAVALGILANEGSIGTLADLLGDTSRGRRLVSSHRVSNRTRAFAAYGLGLIGYRTTSSEARHRIVHLLVQALGSNDTSTDDLGVACVIALGLVPVPAFMPADPADDGPAGSRRAQLEYLIELFGDERRDDVVRAHVPTALVRLTTDLPPEIVAHYKRRIANTLMAQGASRTAPAAVRQSAILALGSLGDCDDDPIDAEIRGYLMQVASEQPDQQSRHFSLISLGEIGAAVGAEAPLARPQVRRFLQDQLEHARPTVKPWAGLGLAVLGRRLGAGNDEETTRAAAKALREALAEEKSPSRMGAYAIALGILRDPEARPLLRSLLTETSDDEARGYVAIAMGLVGDAGSIEPVNELLVTSKYRPDLLRQSSVSLGLLGNKDLVPDLVEMLDEAKALFAQASIASALGSIGDRRSIDPLIAMLKDEDKTDRARSFAAVALGIVADKEPLPWNSKIAVGLNYRAAPTTLDDRSGTGILNIL